MSEQNLSIRDNYYKKKMTKKQKNKLEVRIMELENKREEMKDTACWILADILESKIETLKSELEDNHQSLGF